MPIKNWSTTAASNNATPPNGWPEGQAPSTVNDCGRQMMADIRTQCQDGEWFDWGDTVSRNSATVFKITGDVTTRYLQNRRIKCYDSSTIYGTVVSSSYSAPDTTITILSDSGSLSASLSSVALALLTPTGISVPSTLGRKGSDIASASTTDLSTAIGDFVDVTGTTTITAFGTLTAGIVRTIRFTGALTLTYNATSLILPGGVNITTANGDVGRFVSLGSGNWQCVSYQRASGANVTIGFKGADLASASTVDLSTATGDFVDITGTTTITAFGTAAAGIQRTLRFTGALTLTNNATSLILPGSTNIITANGDTAIFRSLGSGNWKCITYTTTSSVVPFIDSAAIVIGSSDSTKQLRMEVDGFTTATTRVWTAPDRNIDIGKSTASELISSASASASATIDFSSLTLSAYSSVKVVFDNVIPATDGVSFYMRLSTASAFKSGASDYMYAGFASSHGATAENFGSAGAAQVRLNNSSDTVGNNTNEQINGFIEIFAPSNASVYKMCDFRAIFFNTSGGLIQSHGGCAFLFTTAIDGIRFLFSSGNITSGNFYLYGIRAAG